MKSRCPNDKQSQPLESYDVFHRLSAAQLHLVSQRHSALYANLVLVSTSDIPSVPRYKLHPGLLCPFSTQKAEALVLP